MGVFSGPADWWTAGTDAGRTYMSTKGIVQDGLVFNIDRIIPASYPGSGNVVYDISGNNNNATIIGNVVVTSNGFTVDNRDEAVKVTFPQQTKWTLSVWLKKNSAGTGFARVAGTGTVSDAGEVAVYWTDNKIAINPPRDPAWFNTSGTQINGELANIVAVFDTQNTTTNNTFVYKNGVNIYSARHAGTLETLPTSYMFMAKANSATEFLPATMYSACMYSRVLSESEIQRNFNALRGRYGI